MQEGAIMEFVKWFIGLFLLFTLASFTLFAIDVSSVNNFKQQVNYEIERNGGLTSDAVANLEEYSETYYKGQFEVVSDQLYQKVEFGEAVDYTVEASIKIRLFPLADVPMSFAGTGISHVR